MTEVDKKGTIELKNNRLIAFLTLGCKVNQYDTEAMRELFLASGFSEVKPTEYADVYVINTCTVTGTGDRKSMNAIRKCMYLNKKARIVVTGCLAQRAPEIFENIPGVSVVIGTQRRSEIVQFVEKAIETEKQIVSISPLNGTPFEKLTIQTNGDHTRAIMKIQEGCNRFCSYCIIPSVRGPIRSRSLEDIRIEATTLAQRGYKEIVLSGIHLSSYGAEMHPQKNLVDAIRMIHDEEGIKRIRLGSLEPIIITEEFVEQLKSLKKVCPQFHLSLQSGSDRILQLMKRRYTTKEYKKACDILRNSIPDCVITTDVMTGFPTEGMNEFKETLSFCEKIHFANIHVFPYSERKGTVAADLPDRISKKIRHERAKALIELKNKMRAECVSARIGYIEEVLIEEISNKCASGYTRTYFRCLIECDNIKGKLKIGNIYPIRIIGTFNELLYGSIIE